MACGTGGTLAGLAAGLSPAQRALGIPVLRGGFLTADVADLQRSTFGGPRGDWSPGRPLPLRRIRPRQPPSWTTSPPDFAARHDLPPLERIYVAKLLFALTALAEEGAFTAGQHGHGRCHRPELALAA